jgi:hypothetical protein
VGWKYTSSLTLDKRGQYKQNVRRWEDNTKKETGSDEADKPAWFRVGVLCLTFYPFKPGIANSMLAGSLMPSEGFWGVR